MGICRYLVARAERQNNTPSVIISTVTVCPELIGNITYTLYKTWKRQATANRPYQLETMNHHGYESSKSSAGTPRTPPLCVRPPSRAFAVRICGTRLFPVSVVCRSRAS